MKTKLTLLFATAVISVGIIKAQTNTFPETGNVGIGTLTPATDLQVIGTTRMGGTNNYAQVDGSGNLTFKGSGVYKVGGNKYAFQYSASPGYGLFFNSTDVQYEFRDANARPVFYVNANGGDGYFLSGVRVGNSALTTAGNLRWTGSDFEGYNGSAWLSLTGKNSWSLKGNAGTNPATNFIGTTDTQPLMFKINNKKAGYIDFDTAKANTGFGYQTLYSNSTGAYNTANGYNALYSNTSGYYNTANGVLALYLNTTGHFNTADGHTALYSNTTGSFNTANGVLALSSNTTGNYNTANGDYALNVNTTGWYNTALGYYADVSTGNSTNATAIGSYAIADASNKVRVGNTDVITIGGQVSWSTFSDGRYKKNIKEDVKGLSFINSLRPITYTVDINSLNEYYDRGRKHDSNYEKMKKDMQPAADEAAKIFYNGFIAQEVEAAAKKLNYNFSGVDKPQSKDGLYGLRYSDFVVPLVKAVQELSSTNDNLANEVKDLKTQLNAQQNEIDELKALITGKENASFASSKIVSVSNASLEQNIPNPFNHTTTINYILPQQCTSAKIIITDKNGKIIKQVNLSTTGKGSLQLDASALASGAYQYALYVDDRMIGSKQMILTK